MKKFYSVILLFSFLVGALQPILPMIEYQLYDGDIIKLVDSETGSTDTVCKTALSYVDDDCPDCRGDSEEKKLLDTNYYPLAVKIIGISKLVAAPAASRFYLPVVKKVVNPTFLPNPPPPQIS